MPSYLVQWEIDVTADSPREAAEEALRIQRDPDSAATFFKVMHPPEDEARRYTLVDTEDTEHEDEDPRQLEKAT